MGKSNPAPPAAPDPSIVGSAQSASNIATANANATLNRTNQITPFGNITYTPGTPNADGVSQWTSQVSLSPSQQALFDANNENSQSMAGLAKNQIGNVASSANKPLDFNGLPSVQSGNLAYLAGQGGPIQNTVSGLGQVQGTLGDAGGIDGSISGAGNVQNGIGDSGHIQSAAAPAGQIATGIAPAGRIQGSVDAGKVNGQIADSGEIMRALNVSNIGDYQGNAQYGHIQDGLNLGDVPKMVGGDALSDAMKEQQQAAYSQQKAFLDPQWQQDQHDLENKLTQQGVMQNSDAWNRAMDDFGRNRSFAYSQAQQQAIGLGNQAQNQLFGQGLAANQNAYGQALGAGNFANAAQQQGFGQAATNVGLNNAAVNDRLALEQAKFSAQNQAQAQQFQQDMARRQVANSAQAQQFGQGLEAAQFGNSAQAQAYGQNSNNAAFQNAAQGQQYSQNTNDVNLNNAAQGQQYAQNLGTGQFANQAQAQQFSQNAAQTAAQAAAQQQRFNQNLESGKFANDALGQQYSQGVGLANLNNAAQSQKFGQGIDNAQLSNQASAQAFGQSMGARQQALSEQQLEQQNPINILNALRTGSQMQAPSFNNSPTSTVNPTDLSGAFNNQFNSQLGGYNGQVAQNNATTGAAGGLASAALMAFMASDIRLKKNIEHIGQLENGLNVYAYDYIWPGPRQVGVMAHEVEKINPAAVAIHPSGYKMVNYGAL